MSSTSKGTVARTRVLSAAVRVFSARGYDNGSLNDVAGEAGMSRHNLLYYYPSKRDLLIALLENRDADFNARLHWMESSVDLRLADFQQSLLALLPVIYADRELVLLYHRLTVEAAAPGHPARPWVLERYRRTRAAARGVLDTAVARGDVRADLDTEAVAAALLGAIEGIESQWLVDPDVDWNRATTALVEIFTAAQRR